MARTFYVTTPIYYVNDVPHIGHSYTTVAADVLARFHRAQGADVRFLTGTDEHGIKIVKAAAEKGITAGELADQVVVHFQGLWKTLNISNDDFIRTSQARHEKRVQELVRRLVERDEIYRGSYEGWYDEGQEEFITESTARETDYKSAITGKPLSRYSETSYFFRLRKWVPKLVAHIESHEDFVQPPARRNEVLSKLKQGVDDLSISRPLEKLSNWGVPMPNDPTHSVYVWIDALSNYYTALGCPPIGGDDDCLLERYWPCSVHLIGKDILWFHTVYWPCMLLALDIPLPRKVFAHGWWTNEGKKMSKSLGNFISREEIERLIGEYSVDVYRWFLLRAVAFGSDGDFSLDQFRTRYNTELANGIGNLLSRTVNMIGRYFDGRVPPSEGGGQEEQEVRRRADNLAGEAMTLMEGCSFQDYLEHIEALATATNKYIDDTAPFKLAKDPSQRARLGTILYTCAEAVRIVLLHLLPVMPTAAADGLKQLGAAAPDTSAGAAGGTMPDLARWGALVPGTAVRQGQGLFPRKT